MKLNSTTNFGQHKTAQDFLWNLILTIFLEMIPCCLPLYCRKHPILFTILSIHESDNPSSCNALWPGPFIFPRLK